MSVLSGLVKWCRPSLRLSVLDSALLLCPELRNLDLYLRLHASLELLPVAKGEQELEPDKQRREEDGLDQVVQQGGSSALELSVADELRNPTDHMQGNGVRRHGARIVVFNSVVARGGRTETDEGKGGAGDGLEENVQAAPC